MKTEDVEEEGTSFRGANLKGISLAFASLEGTNFRGANLRECNFFEANLHSTDLRDADLTNAAFEGAINFELAKLDGAIMPNGKPFDPTNNSAEDYNKSLSKEQIHSKRKKLRKNTNWTTKTKNEEKHRLRVNCLRENTKYNFYVKSQPGK